MATCGFAVIYNAGWAQIAMAVVGGMAGHGLRFVALDFGCWPEAAALLGGFAVGGVTGWITRSYRTPVALIAFAGAVTMMPGLQIYGALRGGLQLARLKGATDLTSLGETLGDASQAFLVVTALVVGLVVGARLVLALAGKREFPGTLSKSLHNSEQTTDAIPSIR
jgi:uncharacterized membrane protein YjjB (DUF3815 family)